MQINEYFGDIEDPRIERSKLHSLSTIFGLTIVAALCGIKSWEQISLFGKLREKELSTVIDFSNGVPSHDTIERVYSLIEPKSFLECFISWTKMFSKMDKGLVAIDGKVARSSYDTHSGKQALYLVNAWCSENKMVLGQYQTEGKGHEIAGIKELLKLLDIKGSIVSIDAIGCQKEIVEQIIECKADYLIAVKDNQKKLSDEIESSFAVLKPNDEDEQTEKNSGRIEIRKCSVLSNLKMIEGKSKWSSLKTIIKIESTRILATEEQKHVRYYISSKEASAIVFNMLVRSHWNIENCLHWQLDVNFHEDNSRKRKGYSAQNYSLTNKVALNLLNADKESKLSVTHKKLKATYDIEYLKKLMNFDA